VQFYQKQQQQQKKQEENYFPANARESWTRGQTSKIQYGFNANDLGKNQFTKNAFLKGSFQAIT